MTPAVVVFWHQELLPQQLPINPAVDAENIATFGSAHQQWLHSCYMPADRLKEKETNSGVSQENVRWVFISMTGTFGHFDNIEHTCVKTGHFVRKKMKRHERRAAAADKGKQKVIANYHASAT